MSIKAINNSHENKYIKSKKLNGSEYLKNNISYSDIIAGGELVLEMTSEKQNK